MVKYYSISGASGLTKANSLNGKPVQSVYHAFSIIDFIYEIDEDGELISDSNETIQVNKGDIVLKLYGKMVNGAYKRDGRTHIVVSPNKECDMSLFVKMINARENLSNNVCLNSPDCDISKCCSDEVSSI